MGSIIGLVFFLLYIAFVIGIIVGVYKTYAKMGYENVWWIFIPILQLVFFLKVIDKPIWWIVLFFIPFVNIYPAWLLCDKVATAYGKSTGFAVGLMLLGPIFFAILGFSKDQPQQG